MSEAEIAAEAAEDTSEDMTTDVEAPEGEPAEAATSNPDVDGPVDMAGVDDANPKPDEPDAPPEGMHRVKVDGEEIEVDLDELKRGYGRMRSATRKWEEAAQARKQVQAFTERLRGGDPRDIAQLFDMLGIDFTEIAEAHLSEYLAELDMPEHERRLRDLERERQSVRREREQWEAQQREAQIEAEASREYERLNAEVTAALSTAGLADTPQIKAAVAREIAQAAQSGYLLSTEDAVAVVAEHVRSLARSGGDVQSVTGQEAARAVKREEAAKAAQARKRKAAQGARAPAPKANGGGGASFVNPERMRDLKALFDS